MPFCLPIDGWRIVGFILFAGVLVLCEMQIALFRTWTRVDELSSYDDNHCATSASIMNTSCSLKNCEFLRISFSFAMNVSLLSCSDNICIQDVSFKIKSNRARGIMAEVLDYHLEVSEFELHSGFYVHFQTNYHHQVVLLALFSLTLSRHSFLSSIAPIRSSTSPISCVRTELL